MAHPLKSQISNLKSAGAPPLLLQEFDSLADTPGAIPKLRALILDLAIRGALVPQNPQDLPARKLVEFAKVRMKEQRKPHRSSNGDDSNPPPPFPPPQNWCWTRLDDLGDTSPRNDLPDKTEVGFAPMRLITARFGDPISFEPRQWAEVRKGFTHFADGDVVVAKITPCFENGKSGVIRGTPNGSGAGTTELHVFRPVPDCVIPEYVLVFLKSPHFLVNGEQHMTGSAGQKRVPWGYFARTTFPLPPLPEQRRIVAKVEELLALCDELEARQVTTRERRARLVHSALDHLTAAKDEQDFRKQCSFILHNSSLILDSVPALRRAILSLAVQGRLVPQNAKQDGSAGQALGGRHNRLKSNGALRKVAAKAFPPIDESDIPVPVPENWKWIRFGEVVDRLEYGTSEKAFANAKGVPTLRMGNIQDGKLDLENLKHVPYACPDLPKLFLEDGDIIFNRTNSAELVGKAAVFRGRPKSFTLASYLIRASLDGTIASPDFFVLAINSGYYRRTQIEPELTQQCGQANFSGSKLANSVVPLPPIAEQQRIVAKVEELMHWCDDLESRLAASDTTGAHILDAILNEILNHDTD